jgi:TPR repeat protein
MYNSGEGVPRDDAEALKLWRKAAEKGLVAAHRILDKMKDK